MVSMSRPTLVTSSRDLEAGPAEQFFPVLMELRAKLE